ncbi:hypothetical protein BC937DRAFT_88770 [Endogone sp. FLAS-F59071]|nr:hypothetical protein BC937DRAFT_88770 [Endogone sp. FLAS-F59071]|eukprot:RUS18447.1 hypothetical protein BC937DRAFT_88770 [Endogone sp. FLAS-F59071]
MGGVGGNQREKAREKNMKKQQSEKRSREDGKTVLQRSPITRNPAPYLTDAEIMRKKQEAAAAKKATDAASAST